MYFPKFSFVLSARPPETTLPADARSGRDEIVSLVDTYLTGAEQSEGSAWSALGKRAPSLLTRESGGRLTRGVNGLNDLNLGRSSGGGRLVERGRSDGEDLELLGRLDVGDDVSSVYKGGQARYR